MSGPLANASMQVFHHARIIQVRPIGVSKAFLIDRLIIELESKRGPIDLALCMGNFPPMDEDVFGACQPRQVSSPGTGGVNKGNLSPLIATRSLSTPQAAMASQSSGVVTTTTPPATPSLQSSQSTTASEMPLSGATPPLNPARLIGTTSLPPMQPLEIPSWQPSGLAGIESKSDVKTLSIHTMSSPASSTRSITSSPRTTSYAAALMGTPAASSASVSRTVFTIAVGRKHSRAAYYLEGIRAVEKLLEALVDTLPSQQALNSPTLGAASSLLNNIVRPLVLPPPTAVPGSIHALAAAHAPIMLGSPQHIPSGMSMGSSPRGGNDKVTSGGQVGPSSHATVTSSSISKSRSDHGTSTNKADDTDTDEGHTPASAVVTGTAGSPKSATIHATTGLRLLQSR
jgi:hypothetical protein